MVTDDAARNPFLAQLPPHVRRGTPPPPVRPRGITLNDVRDFLLAYCACFLAVSAYIA